VSVREYATRWLRARKAETSAGTHIRYSHVVGKLLAFLGAAADRGLDEITRDQVAAFRDTHLAVSAATTVNADMMTIRSIFRTARRDGLLLEDPAESVKPAKIRSRFERRPFTIDELRSVIEVADDEWRSLIKFGLYTGQRLGDVAAITWAQIDLSRDQIRLTVRKTGKQLLIPIAAPLHEHLLSLAGGSGDNPRAAVHPQAFATAQNGRVSTLSGQFSALLVAAGLRDPQSYRAVRGVGRSGRRVASELSFHSLRHTAVSLMKDAGVPDAVVMALVGHNSAAMSHHYTHVGKEALAKAARSLPEI
jgi:integrase